MAQRFSAAAEAELKCPVCLQFYVPPRDPKHFTNCAHTCCRLCLFKITKRGHTKCPKCNKVSKLPYEGVDALITGLALRNLAEKHPEGIKQRKEYMQHGLAKEKVKTVKIALELRKLEKKMHESIKQEELEVERAVDAIMFKAQELIGRIGENGQPKLTEIGQRLAKLEAQIKSIEATQSTLQTMPDDEFITQTDTLTHQIARLQIDETDRIIGDRRNYKFVANAQLGTIIQPRNLELTQEFGEFNCACGIATLSNKSLVVSDGGTIVVFENKSGKYEKTLEFIVKHRPTEEMLDVATAPGHGDKILIAKCDAKVEMYSSDGKHQKHIDIKCKSDSKVHEKSVSITTTANGIILVGSDSKDREIAPCKVAVCDATGNIIKTIPTNIVPLRITDICGTIVAVSDATSNKVCVYDLYSGKETLNLDIDMPMGIIYDEQSDCLLVTRGVARVSEKDKDGERRPGFGVIEQYCSNTGTLVASLAEGLSAPFGMTLTKDDILAVTDAQTAKLYKIT